MIITDELLGKAYYEWMKTHDTHPDFDQRLTYVSETEWEYLSIPLREFSELGCPGFIDYLTKELGLTPGAPGITILSDSPEWSFSENVDHYMGDDIVVKVTSEGGPRIVYYTKDSVDTMKKVVTYWMNAVFPKVIEQRSQKRFVNILTKGNYGFNEIPLELGDKLNIDISKNYNPDLPDSRVREYLKEDRGGFLVFHGSPGTGKSTYIKHLMETMSEEVIFTVMDPVTLSYSAEEFRNYLISGSRKVIPNIPHPHSDLPYGEEFTREKTRVFILEDAEKLLLKRNETTNPVNLSNLLNITDGIIGDLVRAKFICTFNCSLSEIDEALLRKGRLMLKYEFKNLTGPRLEALCEEQGITPDPSGMSLADIYRYHDTADPSGTKKKIGF